jgi:hypothetical protein
MKRPNDSLLDRINVLVFVHDHIADSLGETRTDIGVVRKHVDDGLEDRRIVKITGSSNRDE